MAHGVVNASRIGLASVAATSLGDVTGATATADFQSVYLQWADPSDFALNGKTVARWAGTLVVRKAGSAPQDRTDGTVVVNSTTRNAYRTTGFTDTGLTNGTVYYYRFFPYTLAGIYTDGSTVSGRPYSLGVGAPYIDGTYTYDGTPQTPDMHYDSTRVTPVSGYPQTDAGEYPVTFHLIDSDTQWLDDGTWDDKVIPWTIDKAPGSISVSSRTIRLSSTTLTKTIDITQVGDGELSITNSNSALVAAALINNNTQLQVTNLGGSDTGTATITIAAAASTNCTAAADVTVTVKVKVTSYSVMTVTIDESDSNPATCCAYADDAATMTAGSADWDEFFGHYPCLFKDGAEVVKLNPNDFTKDINGNAVDITSGDAGDVMIAFPRRGLTMSKSGTIITIQMTNDPDDSSFEYMAHRRGNTQKDVFYIGAYMGSEVSSKLRSLSGKGIVVNQTHSAFQTLAQANGAPDGNGGSGYDQHGWYQLIYLQCMYVLKYRNLDSQTTVGWGYTNNPYNSAIIATGGTETWGMDKKNGVASSGTEHMKIFGIEDLWGNVNSCIGGFWYSSDHHVYTATENFNDSGTGYTNRGTANVGEDMDGYLSRAGGQTHSGFFPTYQGDKGSVTTYYCDYCTAVKSRMVCFGGAWSYGSSAGVFSLLASVYDTHTSFGLGSRLMYV